MQISKSQFKQIVEAFEFTKLFNQLGWNFLNEQTPIKIKEETFTLHSVAEKSGFRIIICNPDKNGKIPDYPTRLKIERSLSKLFKEHLIIFADKNQTAQLWQLVLREQGKPAKLTETRWHKGQDPELLFQKTSSLFFTLDEEENITIIDVTSRVNENFHQNNEKVTKKFYEGFKKEHTTFIAFIKGIGDKVSTDWYASLMMNRLMFCYFIQKKGFLDNNKNYLKDKLKACQEKKGKNKFYSFYRNFLMELFHQGLGSPDHSKELKNEIGKVPYLNGGLFDEHDLEKNYPKIDIDDKAFERLFDFFDQYEWHLDTNINASGKDINPDVIGYIFEKYINDRAEMGAYYTKEDITEYISKNSIIPFLFDKTEREYSAPFKVNGEIWQRVRTSGDAYIYSTLKHGVEIELPNGISAGINDVSKREDWNKPAPTDIALTSEIWREVIDRRKRYNEIKHKIESGDIQNINDFITYNLNIRELLQDVLISTEDPELIKHFYQALFNVTIIDPTCGSGAFLFAAMNILEPLYETCIMRMRSFVEDEDRMNGADKKAFNHKFKLFREVLENLQSPQHPNLSYFIYKSIILRNLYGVDIMKEATEIAKLRLFLKLVATVEADYKKPNLGLEPLPDVDFNIRQGNTLIGFASKLELENALSTDIELAIEKDEILEECDVVAKAYETYKGIQLTNGDNYKEFKKAKETLNLRLSDLNGRLNQTLSKQYGVNSSSSKIDIEVIEGGKKKKSKVNHFNWWLTNYQPFHWFAEFYEIINGNSGFDVVIGNPPYVKLDAKIKYDISKYSTFSCKNLYTLCIERSKKIASKNSYFSMIVPISLVGNKRMRPINKILTEKSITWVSNYSGDTHPGTLFSGVQQNLTIFINKIDNNKSQVFTTDFLRFTDGSSERDHLFTNNIYYVSVDSSNQYTLKLGRDITKQILSKVFQDKKTLLFYEQTEKDYVYYHDVVHYWVKAFLKAPYFKRDGEDASISSHYKTIQCPKKNKKLVVALVSSNLFYLWYIAKSNGRDFSKDDILEFPCSIDEIQPELKTKFEAISDAFIESLEKNKQRVSYDKKSGNVKYDQYWVNKSKSIIDEIDKVLALHYNFTKEELDFIINYDIKYRMGKYSNEEED